MIYTNNAVYLHFPKTGGIWVKNVLGSASTGGNGHAALYKKPKQPHVFMCIRNPFSWYVSYYKFLFNWSTIDNKPGCSLKIFNEVPTFKDYISMMTSPTVAFKRKLYFLHKSDSIINPTLSLPEESKIYQDWVESDNSLYQSFYNTYSKYATYVGKFENLSTDFLDFLKISGDLTTEIHNRINILPAINVSQPSVYQEYYDKCTIKMVLDTSTDIVNQYNYQF